MNNQHLYICVEKEEILITGTLMRLPSPFLTKKRELACRLTVRSEKICSIRRRLFTVPQQLYTVIVRSQLQMILYENAQKNNRVLISGYKTSSRYIEDAQVYKLQT